MRFPSIVSVWRTPAIGALATFSCLAAGLITAGCPKNTSPTSDAVSSPGAAAPSGDSSASAGSATSAVRAALVTDIAGIDDKSFNAASWAGLQKAQTDLKLGADGVKYVEAHEVGDYKTDLASFASQGYTVVFAGSYAFVDALKQVGPQFPKVKFAIIDGEAPKIPNCASLQFKSEQATFLAGYLAASISKTKTIGFVGGQEVPLIKMFESGYIAGAKTADPTVKVVSTYTGSWDDVSKGKSQASQQFASGADIIFHAAGKAGLGVIQAAKEKGVGYFAIGVDQDQDAIAPGSVLTSVVKRVDVAVADTVKRVKDNSFTSGGEVYGLKDGGVGLTEMKYTKQFVPAPVQAHLAQLTKMIIDGKVTPPTTPEALASFQPPKL